MYADRVNGPRVQEALAAAMSDPSWEGQTLYISEPGIQELYDGLTGGAREIVLSVQHGREGSIGAKLLGGKLSRAQTVTTRLDMTSPRTMAVVAATLMRDKGRLVELGGMDDAAPGFLCVTCTRSHHS